MGFHAFSLDPRTILGVGPDASLEEIHDAYRAKSKKHHPDLGGDEWAFRMVARAYEVLKTTTAAAPRGAASWEGRRAGPDAAGASRSAVWPWGWDARFGQPWTGAESDPGARLRRPEDAGGGLTTGDGAATSAGAEDPDATPVAPEAARLDPARMRTVDVELIWTRFEKDGPARLLEEREADDATLSVCVVLSWPEADLVDHTAEFPGGAEILRSLIELFDRLRSDDAVVAARSRIEDGRFVGWLSYPDVLTAQDAVLTVRDTSRSRGLAIKLQTRDERIPFDWRSESHAPLMSQAS